MKLEGLHHVTAITGDARLDFWAQRIPGAFREGGLRGFHGVRAYANDPARSATLLGALGFEGQGDRWSARGVLFELASRDIGFDVDEPRETLGQALKLPAQHEHLREHLEHTLTPLGV